MSPREFLEVVVKPNVAEFHANYADLRCAHNAIAAVDALAAHLFVWAQHNKPQAVAETQSDTFYRGALAKRDASFRLLRDIAKAQKHVRLTQGSTAIKNADQVASRPIGYEEGPYGGGRFGGPKQVVLDMRLRGVFICLSFRSKSPLSPSASNRS